MFTKLQNKYWNCTSSSCNHSSRVNLIIPNKLLLQITSHCSSNNTCHSSVNLNITCHCSSNNTCHVTNILGRRIFDVSIQGNVVLKDFRIMEEAKFVGQDITKSFSDVRVEGSTLEIHLYWSGKGTTFIPDIGIYGPLISSITMTPNFNVDTRRELLVSKIVGIVAAFLSIFIGLILSVLWRKGFIGWKEHKNAELHAVDLQTACYFTLRQIKAATNNFDFANKIDEGGFGSVYKGVLPNGARIVVKQLYSKSKQGNQTFINEIGMISAIKHPNIVKHYGCCVEGNQLLIIYEYLENSCLARELFGKKEQRMRLDWATRIKLCLGITKGLAYLHEEFRLEMFHRDIKATNVLLGEDLEPKISDFGLAKLDEQENTNINTRIVGTKGYMAPKYALRGYLTDKADVYSFRVVALEIVCGKSNTDNRSKDQMISIFFGDK